MLATLIIGFFAGAFAANGIPHFVKGITGQPHMTPFGQPSSPLTNVVWGWLNFVLAGMLWSSLDEPPEDIAYVAAALGALVAAAILASYWAKHPHKNKRG